MYSIERGSPCVAVHFDAYAQQGPYIRRVATHLCIQVYILFISPKKYGKHVR